MSSRGVAFRVYVAVIAAALTSVDLGAIEERFATDPVAMGRFAQKAAGTESSFTYSSAGQNLTAVLDVDQGEAYYLSQPFAAVTDGMDASFSVRFRVEAVDDRFSPAGFIGLMTDQHLGDFGDGLTLVLSTAEGRVVANANVEQGDFQSAGNAIPLAMQREYQAVGRYKAGTRMLTVEILDGTGFTNLVGFSSAPLPQGRELSVNRIGLQNAGARKVDQTEGSITLTVDDLFTPADFPNRLAIHPVEILEGHSGTRNAVFPVTLTPATSVRVAVRYVTSDGTATERLDYLPVSGTLMFPPGASALSVAVPVIGDTLDEDDETFFVTLSQPVDAVLEVAQATGTILDDDPAPLLFIRDASVVEGDSGLRDMVFLVELSAASGRTITATYATSSLPPGPNSATAGIDYVATTGTLVFAPGQTLTNVAVQVIGDLAVEDDENFLVTLSNLVNALPGRLQATGTIIDDDRTRVLSINDVAVQEGNAGTTTDAVFTVRLSSPSTVPVRVDYSTAGETATLGTDFQAASGALTFGLGETEVRITVVVLGDDLPESDETFVVNLSNPVNAGIGKGQGRGTILNDDPYPALSVLDTSVIEGNSGSTEAVFLVTLAPVGLVEVTVQFATADGTATAGSDYQATSGTLRFSPGVTEQVIRVPVFGDLLDEENETFLVTLSGPVNAVIAGGRATGTILDDDDPPELSIAGVEIVEGNSGTRNAAFPLTLSAPSGRTVSVSFATEDGTARVADNDYQARVGSVVFPPGSTRQIVAIPVVGDTKYEPDETFFVQLSNPAHVRIAPGAGRAQGIILNDDNPPSLTINDVRVREGDTGTRDATFTVRLSEPSGRTARVSFRTSDGTAQAGSDYVATSGNVEFKPGETTKTITVKVIGDRLAEPDETFFVDLTDEVNATLQRSRGVGTIEDDDICEVTIDDVRVREGDEGITNAVFTVRLSLPNSQTVTVNYTTTGGTATSGVDFLSRTGSLTFDPGLTVQTITVPVIGDRLVEPDETFFVDLSGAVNARITRSRGVGTIIDDDTRELSINDVWVIEGDAGTTTNALFTVRLLAPSFETVTVDYATADGTATQGLDYVATSGRLTFPAGTLTQTIAVTVIGDDLPEPDETFLVNLLNPHKATIKKGQGIGTIIDDDLTPVIVPAQAIVTAEDCLPANGAIDPWEVVTVDFALANVGNRPTTNLVATLVEADGVRPLSGPQSYGVLPARGAAVTRPFTFQVEGECGQAFTARLELTDAGRPLTNVVFNLTLGHLIDGRPVCCQTADLGVAVTDQPDPVYIGQTLTYTAVVINRGPLPATQAGLTNRLPDGVQFVSAVASQGEWELTGDLLRCNLGRLEPGAQAVVTVTVVPEAAGQIHSSFRVGSLDNDPNPGDNIAVEATTVLAPEGLSINNFTVTEGDEGFTDAVFTVWLHPQTGRTVTVEYLTMDGTATAGTDYVATSGVLTFPSGATTAHITVRVIGDRLVEPDETFWVHLRNPVNATLAVDRGVGTILDDDLPEIQIDDVTVEEPPIGATTDAVFQLLLSVPISRIVTVEYATSDDTARAGSDYEPGAGLLTFTPGEIAAEVRVPVRGDALPEPDETFFLNLSRPVNATLARPRGIATILDHDEPPPLMTIDDVRVLEGKAGTTTQAVFTVRLTTPSRRTASVDYATANGTATAGTDYVFAAGRLEFPPGTTQRQISVTVNGDDFPEFDETFFVNLVHPVNAMLAVARGIGTILNDDYLGRPEPAGTSLVAEDCQPPNGVVDPWETVIVQFWIMNRGIGSTTNLTARMLESDGVLPLSGPQSYGALSPGGSAVGRPFTFQALGECGDRVVVRFALQDGIHNLGTIAYDFVLGRLQDGDYACCAQADVAVTATSQPEAVELHGLLTYTLLVHNHGPSLAKSVTILNRLPEEVRLVSVSGSTGEFAVAGPFVTGQLGHIPVGEQVEVTITVEPQELGWLSNTTQVSAETTDPLIANNTAVIANRVDPPTGISINDVTVTEGPGATAEFTVRLFPPSGRLVTVDFATLDGTALAGSDYVAAAGTLRFDPGVVELPLAIAIIDDDLDEPDEVFHVELSNPVGAALARHRGTATILDDDPPGISINDVEVNVGLIGGAVASLDVTLSSAAEQIVSISFATEDGTATSGTDYETRSGTIRFHPGETRATIEIEISGNTFDEGIEFFLVRLFDPVHATLIKAVGRVTITDENPGRLAIADVQMLEGNTGQSQAVFHVTLDAPNRFTVRVDYATSDGTARADEDYLAVAGTLVFEPGVTTQSLSVPILGDTVYEPDETFFVNLTNPRNARLARTRATGTILNDDPEPVMDINDVQVVEGHEGLTNALFTVSLRNPSSLPVRAEFRTADGTAKAGQDYHPTNGTLLFAPLQTTQIITVHVIGDRVDEPDEEFYVDLDRIENAVPGKIRGVGTILDDDPPPEISINSVSVLEGDTGITDAGFTVWLSAPSSFLVSVQYATTDLPPGPTSATAGADYLPTSGTLEFPPGETLRTLVVGVLGDTIEELDEQFVVQLANPMNARLRQARGVGTIIDDDEAPPPPPLCPQNLTIITPAHRTCFEPGSSIIITAAPEDGEEHIERIEFYVGSVLLGVNYSPPYVVLWEDVPVGEYCLTTRAVCPDGHDVWSPPVCVTVSHMAGEVALVQDRPALEIALIEAYLMEMGLCPVLIDLADVSFDVLDAFQLVILHLGPDGQVYPDLIAMLDRLLESPGPIDPVTGWPIRTGGMPLFIIGEGVAAAASGLAPAAQVRWQQLSRLHPQSDTPTSRRVSFVPDTEAFMILRGVFGNVQDFESEQDLERAVSLPDATVWGYAEVADVFLTYPDVNLVDSGQTRSATQNFQVTVGGDPDSVASRKALFQNTVCWLLRCSDCTYAALHFEYSADTVQARVGEVFKLPVLILNGGACEARASRLRVAPPEGIEFLDANFERGGHWSHNPATGWVQVEIGRVGSGHPAGVSMDLAFRATEPGQHVIHFELLSNNTLPYKGTRTVGITGESVRPTLQVERLSDGRLRLVASGASGHRYRVQFSHSLTVSHWQDWVEFDGPDWSSNPMGSEEIPAAFYRVLWP